MSKILSNPFFIYIFSFVIVLITYSFGWSNLYPTLSFKLLLFLLVTFIICIPIGIMISKSKKIEFTNISWVRVTPFYTILIWIGYFLEFLYHRAIPLVLIVQPNTSFDYTTFGIPTFHVLLATFNGFYAVYLFHQLISEYTRTRLFYYILNLIPSLLIYNRGMFLMIITACLFVYLLSLQKLRVRTIVYLGLASIVILYFFGLSGNLRQTQGTTTDTTVLLNNGQANQQFRESIIPKKYFWGYLYISSPLANLQQTINKTEGEGEEWMKFINYEILPDFISKRTSKILSINEDPVIKVTDWLTVSTFYTHSYVYLGWFGLVMIFLFFVAVNLIYIFLLKKSSKYYVTGLALLNTIAVYNTFDNMFAFTGLIFQLSYPLILSCTDSIFKKSTHE